MATGFGMKPVRHKSGSPYTGECTIYTVLATDAATLGPGSPVKLAGSMDAAGQTSVVTQATAGDTLIGVVTGIIPCAAIPLNQVYKQASVLCQVEVADDPDLIFEVQEDAIGGSMTAANIGAHYTANLVFTSATADTDTGSGMSKAMLDSSTAESSGAVLEVTGVRRDQSNAAAQTGGAVLEVMIALHALTQ